MQKTKNTSYMQNRFVVSTVNTYTVKNAGFT